LNPTDPRERSYAALMTGRSSHDPFHPGQATTLLKAVQILILAG
jgi:hypothetical protein